MSSLLVLAALATAGFVGFAIGRYGSGTPEHPFQRRTAVASALSVIWVAGWAWLAADSKVATLQAYGDVAAGVGTCLAFFWLVTTYQQQQQEMRAMVKANERTAAANTRAADAAAASARLAEMSMRATLEPDIRIEHIAIDTDAPRQDFLLTATQAPVDLLNLDYAIHEGEPSTPPRDSDSIHRKGQFFSSFQDRFSINLRPTDETISFTVRSRKAGTEVANTHLFTARRDTGWLVMREERDVEELRRRIRGCIVQLRDTETASVGTRSSQVFSEALVMVAGLLGPNARIKLLENARVTPEELKKIGQGRGEEVCRTIAAQLEAML